MNNEEQETPEVTEQSIAQSQSSDPAEMAAKLFTLYFPKFENFVNGLSNKDLKRLVLHLVGEPLIDTKFKSQNQSAKYAFTIGERLLQAKNMLVFDTLAKQGLQEQAPVEDENNLPENNKENENDSAPTDC